MSDDPLHPAQEVLVGAGIALLTCINHIRTTKVGSAVMRYQIELEDGTVESYHVEVSPVDSLVEMPVSKTLN